VDYSHGTGIEPHRFASVHCRRFETTEDYLDLSPASKRRHRNGHAVIIEGETPPRDPRLKKLRRHADPGVIEVNMHPSNRWDDSSSARNSLRGTRQTRLGAEKFMLDGRHTGTGRRQSYFIAAKLRRTRRFCATGFVALAADVLAESSIVELAVQRIIYWADVASAAH